MLINLIRYAYTPDETLGVLRFPIAEVDEPKPDQVYMLYTVECPWLENAPFMSCIPDGGYTLQAFESARHPDCWVITPVPGRTGILVHSGNKVADVTGCVAPGLTRTDVCVWDSQDAMRLLNYVLDRNVQHQIAIGPGLGARLASDERGDQKDDV